MLIHCSDELVTEAINDAVEVTSEALQPSSESALARAQVAQMLAKMYTLSTYRQYTVQSDNRRWSK